jgi:release factor glutamine methyltransferase
VNVNEAIRVGEQKLRLSGVESAELEANWLIAHVLRMPRLELFLVRERVLTEAEMALWTDLMGQRCQRIPLQHLMGSVGFLDWDIRVTRDVLIPRPETESLVRAALDCLKADSLRPGSDGSVMNGSGETGRQRHVLDFGTGSGCISIALAAGARELGIQVHALDVSEAALAVARDNANRNGVGDRISWYQGDGFAGLPRVPSTAVPGIQFDMIVSNPPYIATHELDALPDEVRLHDPRLALDGGLDGLRFYRQLAACASEWLVENGWLMAEFGDGQGEAIRSLFRSYRTWGPLQVEKDLSGRDRIFMVRSRS